MLASRQPAGVGQVDGPADSRCQKSGSVGDAVWTSTERSSLVTFTRPVVATYEPTSLWAPVLSQGSALSFTDPAELVGHGLVVPITPQPRFNPAADASEAVSARSTPVSKSAFFIVASRGRTATQGVIVAEREA